MGAGAAAVAAFLGFKLGGGGEKAPAGTYPVATSEVPGDANGDGYLSKDELRDMSFESVVDVAKHDPKLLLSAYAPDFDAWRKDTNTILNNKGYFLTVDPSVNYVPTGSKEAYSDQDVLVQVMLDVADASIQKGDAGSEIGKRMLTLVRSPGEEDFLKAVDHFETSQGRPDLNIYKTAGESYRITASSFDGIDLSNYTQVRLVREELVPANADTRHSEIWYGLYGLVKDGSNSSWMKLQRFDPDSDVMFNGELAKLRAGR